MTTDYEIVHGTRRMYWWEDLSGSCNTVKPVDEVRQFIKSCHELNIKDLPPTLDENAQIYCTLFIKKCNILSSPNLPIYEGEIKLTVLSPDTSSTNDDAVHKSTFSFMKNTRFST